MKKLIAGIAIGLTLGIAGTGVASQYWVEDANFPILVNGKEFKTDKPIVTIDGSTYLPLRAIGEALGVKVAWNDEKGQAEIGETPSIGYSMSNPAPVGTAQIIQYKDILDSYTAEMSIKDIIRGSEALKLIKAENQFNDDPKEGYEYILAKVNFKLTDIPDGKVFDLSDYKFKLISSDGKEYETASVVNPSPDIAAKLYKGSSNEGWAVFVVKKDDTTPKIAFGRKYDGTGGIWFKAYK